MNSRFSVGERVRATWKCRDKWQCGCTWWVGTILTATNGTYTLNFNGLLEPLLPTWRNEGITTYPSKHMFLTGALWTPEGTRNYKEKALFEQPVYWEA